MSEFLKFQYELKFQEFTHNYDNGLGGTIFATSLTERSIRLIEKWVDVNDINSKEKCLDSTNSLVLDWYNINTLHLCSSTYDPLWL